MYREEMETIIVFNEKNDEMIIETPNKALQKKIEELGVFPRQLSEFDNVAFKEYSLPKKWLKVRKPRELSEEMRQKLQQRAKDNFGRGK